MKKSGGNGNNSSSKFNFSSVMQVDVPQARNGKHKKLVTRILADLEHTAADTAVRIPLNGLAGEKMQNVRSALNRATRSKKMEVATAADEKYLYVWCKDKS